MGTTETLKFTVGFNGFFKNASPALQAILGLKAGGISSYSLGDLVHHDDLSRIMAEHGRIVQGESHGQVEARLRTPSGSYRWYAWSLVGMAEAQIYFATLVDITARKEEVSPAIPSAGAGVAVAEELRGTETVLVVEDNPIVQVLVEESLRPQGYTVIIAADGQEALSVYEKHPAPIDLVLTDLAMPKLNGARLIEALSRKNPLPQVLYMSAYTVQSPLVKETNAWPDRFLQKPFTTPQLLKKVRDVLALPRPA